MANNYAQATIQPVIPRDLFTDIEIRFLELSGFTAEIYQKGDVKVVYLYAESNFDMEGDTIDESYLPEVEAETFGGMTTLSILQNVIKKSAGEITEIIVEASFTCEKMRPGEFGGYCARITEETIQEGGTAVLLDWFRANPGKDLYDDIYHQPVDVKQLAIGDLVYCKYGAGKVIDIGLIDSAVSIVLLHDKAVQPEILHDISQEKANIIRLRRERRAEYGI